MRTGRTRAALLGRLDRLEVQTAVLRPIKIRFGHLRRLLQDYKGERHVIVAKQLPSRNGQEWVEFEEVPGPDPSRLQEQGGQGSVPTQIDLMLVAPYPRQEQMP